MRKYLLVVLSVASALVSIAQEQTIRGKVTNDEGANLAGVYVIIKGTEKGTTTDDGGNFSFAATQQFPFTIVFSYVNHHSFEYEVKRNETVRVKLQSKIQLQEVTVSAPSRFSTKLVNSPVSIEQLDLKAIQSTPAADPFDALAYQKGIDVVASSFTFKTPSTRGFNGSGSARVNQWVDGMDNQAPGMNFSIGNFAGITNLDLESIEVLPGASSALYGPGGMSGTIFMNSKSPFKYTGLSIMAKGGVMNIDGQQRPNTTGYQDYSIRFAKSFKDKFAFKIAAQYLRAHDWLANDSSNYNRPGGKGIAGTRSSDPNYDGVNVYGDETTVNIRPFIPPVIPLPPDPIYVSRTGYNEADVIDPITLNLKLSAAFHYKISTNTEAIVAGNFGTGNTVYTGSDRYALKNVKIGQYKVELRNKNWFLRAYTTQENAGDSYAATTVTRYLNEVWKPSNQWYGQYTQAFVPTYMQTQNLAQAHAFARSVADQGRPTAGSPRFNQILDSLRQVPISKGGGLFIDRSNLYMVEGQYNFGKRIGFAEILVGGNYKRYDLNSKGTIFIDSTAKIGINEFGGYIQATKKLFGDRLILSASGRMDKNENFAGKFTPRFTALLKIANNNNLRFSYQTAYRLPTTQQQFIKLKVGENIYMMGGLPWIIDFMNIREYPVQQITATGLQPYQYKAFKPESSNSFEVGYKGVIGKKLFIDMYGYLSRFENFLGRINLFQPGTQRIYSIVTNSESTVKSAGYGISLQYPLSTKLTASANYYSDRITDVPDGFAAAFNTPKHRVNTGLTGSGIGKNRQLGFGIQYKWQDSFDFENDFANGHVEKFSTLDAQVNHKIAEGKGEIRLGATNLLNKYYKTAFGNPEIGGLYYASLRFDIQ